MIAQHLEHAAIRYPVAAAFGDHPFQFLLQRLKPQKPLFDLFQLALGNRIRVGARAG